MYSRQTQVLISNILCKIAIWYDYTLFISLCNLISKEFCCGRNIYYNILQIFGITGISAIGNPIGALIFGHIGDKFGRKIALPIAILLISIPSSFIAFIPSYSQAGVLSTVMLILVRIIQGIASGAEQGASVVCLMEHLPNTKKKLGMLFGVTSLGRSIGILLCAIVLIMCKKMTNFNSWGWKLPFTFSAILGLISAYSTYMLGETLIYQQINQQQSGTPIIELIKYHKRAFILAILMAIPVNVIVGFTTFLRTLVKEMDEYHTIYIDEIASIMISILVPLFSIVLGILADHVGRKRTSVLFIIIAMILCCPILSIVYYCRNYLILILSIVILSVVEKGINPIGIVISELFPAKVRLSGVSLSRNFSFTMHGAFTPMICAWFTIMFPRVSFIPGLYIMFSLLIGLIAILQIKPQP